MRTVGSKSKQKNGVFVAYLPDEFINEVLSRNDIIDVVGGYVQLTKKGNNFWGLCPFHNEKTPSFSVKQDQQFYYCFGCHSGGNVIQFIQKNERLDFVEAVRVFGGKSAYASAGNAKRQGLL